MDRKSHDGTVASAEEQWRTALAAWAIPPAIVAAAARSPWGHPADRFALRADTAVQTPGGASFQRALATLVAPGSVLDVGAGVGAASLPLLHRTTALTAVDPSEAMLGMLRQRATSLAPEVSTTTVVGRWPESAETIVAHDLVVCHHVFYDVADLGPFVRALTARARRRVVVELPPVHPQTWMAPLWEHFHAVQRPTTPTWRDAAAVITATGVRDLIVDHWTAPDPGHPIDVALITRRLCLPESAEPEVAAFRDKLPPAPRAQVTLTWAGAEVSHLT